MYQVFVNVNMWGDQKKVYEGKSYNQMMTVAEKYTGGWKDTYYSTTLYFDGYEIDNPFKN